ncbi:MAG: GAF domain-containing protein [Anaerolineales bacterium]
MKNLHPVTSEKQTNMRDSIAKFLELPDFGNIEKNLTAHLTLRIYLAIVGTSLIFLVYFLVLFDENSMSNIGIILGALFFIVVAIILLRKGLLELSTTAFIIVCYAAVITSTYQYPYGVTLVLELALGLSLINLLVPVWQMIMVIVLTVGTFIHASLIRSDPPQPIGDVAFAIIIYLAMSALFVIVSRARANILHEVTKSAQQAQDANRHLESITTELEQRAAQLNAVAEISTATSTILDFKRLLQEVMDLTKERFNLYHSHIYLLDEAGEHLILTAGAGEPGRQMVAEGRTIPLSREQSLVARAARERQGITVNDVTQAPDFLPNPLLPNTRSELAVPMTVGGNVIGVFDIQSDQVGRFTDSDVNIQTTLAAQLAASVQNARSFEKSKTQADLESLVNTIGQKIQRSTTVEDTLQVAIRELGSALGATRVKAMLGTRSNGGANEGAN